MGFLNFDCIFDNPGLGKLAKIPGFVCTEGNKDFFMLMPTHISVSFFAPCGMNCMVCYVHLKKKKPCTSCYGDDSNKPERCRRCKIKNCAVSKELKYCYQCNEFPCRLVKNLEKSYLKRYQVSLVNNNRMVQKDGIESFLKSEVEKWECPFCKGVVSLHDGKCSGCGTSL